MPKHVCNRYLSGLNQKAWGSDDIGMESCFARQMGALFARGL